MTSAEMLRRTGAAMLVGALCAVAASQIDGAGSDDQARDTTTGQGQSFPAVATHEPTAAGLFGTST
ncbi:MAG: hypothetical protein ACR2PM_12910 [Hyphomicrobiales bacterium]